MKKEIKILLTVSNDLNEKLLDKVAEIRKESGKRTSKQEVIINAIKKEL